jgi:hypothetical protein
LKFKGFLVVVIGYRICLGSVGGSEVLFENYASFCNDMIALGKVASDVATFCIRPSSRIRKRNLVEKRNVEPVTLERQLSF